MSSLWRRLRWVLPGCFLAGTFSFAVATQQPQTVSQGVYSDQQAARGQKIYKDKCTSCHGDSLAGRTGPPLAGNDFIGNWDKQPLSDLFNKIALTMPKDATAKLSRQDSADLLAYILQVGKFPAGQTELQTGDARSRQPRPGNARHPLPQFQYCFHRAVD